LKVLCGTGFLSVVGEIDGKIETKTQGGQQEAACPLENPTQKELITVRR
jgi:hypothetical protein